MRSSGTVRSGPRVCGSAEKAAAAHHPASIDTQTAARAGVSLVNNPIIDILTSATAIGGLLPLALENVGLYSPMAWVIIGGLITSTPLARLVTPVMYRLIPPQI
ncbi:MAG TPA: efflux RND transporter permease subunit [Steroidobacteraceae bacterium]|nr:efflux RND transporter permease subunit [Steroidobacteraceae bacterium]